MSDASGIDLEQFKNWYRQAGTPVLQVKGKWNEADQEYRLLIRQSCPDTPEQTAKKPFHMPITVGLLDQKGNELLEGSDSYPGSAVLQLRENEQLFTFPNIKEQPVVSFLRDFSAPVRVESFQSHEELALLMRADANLYNRWDASTRLAGEVILEIADQLQNHRAPLIEDLYTTAVSASLQAKIIDPALFALALQLPAEMTLAQEMDTVDPDALFSARQHVKKELAKRNKERFLAIYHDYQEKGAYTITPEAMGRRSLKNIALNYLMALDPLPEEIHKLCFDHYSQATNMTDAIAALGNLVNIDGTMREDALEDFYRKWRNDPLVLDKWFSLQALSILENTLDKVVQLTANSSFSISNPNKVRALVGVFCSGNHVRFHNKNGSGYRFLADRIEELNAINPQIAARLLSPLISWRRYDGERQKLMQQELKRILEIEDLSSGVYEIVTKSI